MAVYDGMGVTCPNESIVEVWRVKDDDGFHIKLRRKLEDGKMSLLKFGMSRESAIALVGLLQMQMCPEDES